MNHYQVFQNGQKIAEGSAKQCAAALGVKLQSFYTYILRSHKGNKRLEFKIAPVLPKCCSSCRYYASGTRHPRTSGHCKLSGQSTANTKVLLFRMEGCPFEKENAHES